MYCEVCQQPIVSAYHECPPLFEEPMEQQKEPSDGPAYTLDDGNHPIAEDIDEAIEAVKRQMAAMKALDRLRHGQA